MKTFDDWYAELIEDERWREQASIHHKTDTFYTVAQQIYTFGIADSSGSFFLTPIAEHRRHLFNKLSKLPPDRPKKKWWVKESDKEDVKPEAPPLVGEARERWLNKWKEALAQTPAFKTTPKLTSQMIEEEGGVRPKAVQPYPATSLTEFEKHQRHLEWIKYAYDPRTGDRIPGTLDEDEFTTELNK